MCGIQRKMNPSEDSVSVVVETLPASFLNEFDEIATQT